MRTHGVAVHLALALALVVIANAVVAVMLHGRPTLESELGTEALIVVISLALPIGVTISALWPQLKVMVGIVSDASPAATPTLLRFVSEELRALEDRISDTRARGVDMKTSTVTAWARARCFAVATGAYLATDVLVPSEFIEKYEGYLRAHAAYVKDRKRRDSVRVNLASIESLLADRVEHPEAWARYVDWHTANNVDLLHCERKTALEVAGHTEMGNAQDLALWEGDLVLMVEYLPLGEATLRISFVGDTGYRRSKDFLDQIKEAATPFGDVARSRAAVTGGESSITKALRSTVSRHPRLRAALVELVRDGPVCSDID